MVLVYGIQCVVNGYVYVGCTAGKLAKRMREHRCLLKQKRHASPKMIEDWHLYGEQSFVTLQLETLPNDSTVKAKRDAELKWMHHFSGLGKIYNVFLHSFGGDPERARLNAAIARSHRGPMTAATIEKIRLGNSKPKRHGAKVSATKKALGQQPSRACIEKSVAVRKEKARLRKELKI